MWKTRQLHLEKGIAKLLIVLFALCTCRSLYLAFDKDTYSQVYAFLSLNIARMCVPVGIVYLLFIKKIERRDMILAVLPVTYWLMQIVHTYGGYSGGGELTFFTSIIFVLLNREMKGKIFRTLYWIIQLNNLISIILWVSFFLFDKAGFTRELFYAQNGLESAYYYRFGIFAIYSYGGHSFRLCGIFNEPGALGTVCALLFICTFKQSKWWEKVLLLMAGAFTLSFAFALLVFGFVAVYICKKKPSNIIYIIIFLGIFLAIPNIDFHNDAINDLAGRFAITEGGFSGDNRTSSAFDAEYEAFSNSMYYWLGKGDGAVLASGVASYKSSYIVPFGVFGMVLLLGEWLISSYRYSEKNRQCLLYMLFFFISLYQRPYAIIAIWGYVFLFGGMAWQKSIEKQS